MVFSHIHSLKDKDEINNVNHHIKKGKPAFLLIFMEGCGPCEATRPEWKKLENVLSYLRNDENIMIADIDQDLLENLPSIKEKPAGFPTMLYIQGNEKENYEGGRSITDFVKWIKDKKVKVQKGGSKRRKRKTLKKRGGRKRKTLKKRKRN